MVLFTVGSVVVWKWCCSEWAVLLHGKVFFCSVRVGNSSVWCGWCYSEWVALSYGKGIVQSG